MSGFDAAGLGGSNALPYDWDDLEDRTGHRFLAYMGEHRQTIEDDIFEKGPHALRSSDLFRDLDKMLYGPLRRFTARGGKRIRPTLAMLACEAVGGSAEMTLPVGYALEYFQSSALIHDDIFDGATRRRCKPALHLKEGIGSAINEGNLAMIAAYDHLLADETLDESTKMRLVHELIQMGLMRCEGQALDLGWVREGRWDVTPDEYYYMVWHKTAYYTAGAPLAMGAICGGATDDQIRDLRTFGLDIGLAYQIQDDLLNLIGDADSQGKDARNDITSGKRTLVVLHALSHLEPAERAELQSILDAGTDDAAQVSRAVELLYQAGSIEYACNEALQLVRGAQKGLPADEFEPGPYAMLMSLADFFIRRIN